MKRKNRLSTNSTRTIKKAFPRFLSLIVMSLLGVMVFVGLLAVSPDMLQTLDNYYDKQNAYDIKLLSTMGLIEDDIETLKNIDNIKEVEGVYSTDILLSSNNNEYVVNISSIPKKINKIELVEGKLPTKDNEIVVEENFLTKTKYKMGDTITVNTDDLKNKELKIVGTVISPLYFNQTNLSQTRGTSSLGTGSVNYYSFIPSTNFNVDYYTNIYVTIKNAKEKITSKDDYLKLLDNTISEIENIKDKQEDNRYQNIYNEALEEIEKNEKEINKELKNAKKELDKAKKELNSSKKTLDSTKKQLATFKNELEKAKKELDSGKSQYEKVLKENGIKEKEISSNIKLLKENIANLEYLLPTLDKSTQEYIAYNTQLKTLKEQLKGLETLQSTKNQLDKGYAEYQSNKALYTSSYSKYTNGLSKYNSGLKKYNKGLKEYKDGKKEAEEKIKEAKEELNTIDKPIWYIFDRSDEQTYSTYVEQTKSLKSLATVFPLVFYAVAILVSLISMNRMVEDDRGEIGTLKSLGFTNKEIIAKYLRFSLLATLIGGCLGIALGLTVIPYLIFIIYRILFVLPNFHIGLNIIMSLTGLGIAILCICGATLITAYKVLKGKPATLMRPKAPEAGKKILLEHIPIWHKINFSNKITIRNIFRYKKRVLVTIVGICGCTALMLCGFGIKDSIVNITKMQYIDTFNYEETVYTKNLDINKVEEIFTNDKITEYVLAEQITATINESTLTMIALDSTEFTKIFTTKDLETDKETVLTKDSIMITDKLAELQGVTVGDTITILDGDTKEYTLKITNIVKNYMGHYIYIDKSQLEEYKPNIVFLKTNNISSKQQDELSKELLKNDSIINVIHTETLMDSTSDMVKSLDLIIAVLIVLAAALSFVVLYNLSNINITERKREIATLKVLGFYDKEVDNYITRENLILTILGIIPGYILGYFLMYITIGTVEMENTRFLRTIEPISYLYAALISLIFTFIVNFVTHFSLKKIDMIESLKSVE